MGEPTQRATNYTARSNIDTAQIFLHANGQRPKRAPIRQRSRRRRRREEPHTEHGLGVLLALTSHTGLHKRIWLRRRTPPAAGCDMVVSRCLGIGPPSGIPPLGRCFCWPPIFVASQHTQPSARSRKTRIDFGAIQLQRCQEARATLAFARYCYYQ